MSYKVTKKNTSPVRRIETFQTFEDLEVYKAARQFRSAMYGVSRRLPEFEKYESGRQIRRAAVSATCAISEAVPQQFGNLAARSPR